MGLESSFRKELAQKIKDTPKENRGETLDQSKHSSEYWQERGRHIQEKQNEEATEDGLGVLLKMKTIYHGSGISGIEKFNLAEEDTVGQGVYFTSEPKDAIGYARRRSRREEDHKPVVYEVAVENMRLLDLRKEENLKKILPGFSDALSDVYEERKKTNSGSVDIFSKVLRRIRNDVDAGKIGLNNLKAATQQTGRIFSDYVRSLGYEGLVVLEGGEGEDVGNHDTYLIFDSERLHINSEQEIV